ncbi:MAG: hypothetical protein AB7G12_12625 [Thermoanaerobaculia bacterium]
MKLDTLQASYADVRGQLLEYRAAVKRAQERKPLDDDERRQLREDRRTLRMLNALSRGEKLLDVHQAIAAAGCKADGSPALAIARANWQYCFCAECNGHIWFRGRPGWHDHRLWAEHVPRGLLPGFAKPVGGYTWRAVVPQIPPRHRPAGNLMHYHILWEAEWDQVPTDPVLLKHLFGSFYAVLAVWDLTAVERAVLGTREVQR